MNILAVSIKCLTSKVKMMVQGYQSWYGFNGNEKFLSVTNHLVAKSQVQRIKDTKEKLPENLLKLLSGCLCVLDMSLNTFDKEVQKHQFKKWTSPKSGKAPSASPMKIRQKQWLFYPVSIIIALSLLGLIFLSIHSLVLQIFTECLLFLRHFSRHLGYNQWSKQSFLFLLSIHSWIRVKWGSHTINIYNR